MGLKADILYSKGMDMKTQTSKCMEGGPPFSPFLNQEDRDKPKLKGQRKCSFRENIIRWPKNVLLSKRLRYDKDHWGSV